MLASNAIAMRPAAIGLAKVAIKAPPVTTSSPLETTILLTGSGLVLTSALVPALAPCASPFRLCADRHRSGADPDPPDLDPRHQHVGQSGPVDGRRPLRRHRGAGPIVAVLGCPARGRGDRRLDLARHAIAWRSAGKHRQRSIRGRQRDAPGNPQLRRKKLWVGLLH